MTPFDGKNMEQIQDNICKQDIKFRERCWKPVSDDAKDFVLQCLVRDQEERPSINDLFEHPWIKDQTNDGYDDSNQLKIQRNLNEY